MMMKTVKELVFVGVILVNLPALEQPAAASGAAPHFSTAGFHELPGAGHTVFNFNVGWRFLKADAAGAEQSDYDDKAWAVVNLPHGLELLPSEASGGVNYQGPAWYRKHFRIPENLSGQRLLLHFEAIMGKGRVWLDGELLAEHFGGYLPVVIDLATAHLDPAREHVIAVRANNSDDPTYPPGKAQDVLDFAYFGGIYRDVWLVATGPIHITDPHLTERVAGGGVFAHFENVGKESATVIADTEVANTSATSQKLKVVNTLRDVDGQLLAEE